MIPTLSAFQGHPEAPHLWEKHADKIIKACGLKPTVHEPCLYSGTVDGERVLLKQQVDDFAVASRLEMINDALMLPLKPLDLVDMFNCLNILQTRDYVKILCSKYIEKISEKHLENWMKTFDVPAHCPTPLPS